MRTETKIIGGIALVSVLIIAGATILLTGQSQKEQEKLGKPLSGTEVPIQGAGHVPDGTQIQYNSNPPTSGPHYNNPQPAGIYDNPVPDGNLVHSMEHGAGILWYRPDLSKDTLEALKQVFDSANVSKKIMVPRSSLDVQVALTSWGRLLKIEQFEASDSAKIKQFLETNEDRGPEKAPL